MKSQEYDNQQLTQYLLGALPEAQTEACDELSFVDDDFAARLETVENDLVDAYVRGEIAGRDLAAFESYYLASPRRREKVAFAQSLQEFAAQQVATVPVTAPPVHEETRTAPPTTSWWRSLLERLTLPLLPLQLGMAAAALLMLFAGGWFIWQTVQMRGQMGQVASERNTLEQREKELQAQLQQQQTAATQNTAQLQEELKRTQEKLMQLERAQQLAQQQAKAQVPPAEAQIVALDLTAQTRAVGQLPTLRLSPQTNFALLQVELEDDLYPHYVAELRGGMQSGWKSRPLRSRTKGESKFLDISISAARLSPHSYVLTINGIAADGSVNKVRSYVFSVVK